MNRHQKFALLRALASDLDVIVGALRSGAGLLQAIQVVGQSQNGPLQRYWLQWFQDVQHGASWDLAFAYLEQRCPIPPIQSFSMIVRMLHSTGGNMAGALQTLAESIHQEVAFQGKLQAMTAQGRMSGYVISAMPFIILGSLAVLTPELIRPLFQSAVGWILLLIVGTLVTIGTCLIQRIVRIDL
jgi:tight adherence protein B